MDILWFGRASNLKQVIKNSTNLGIIRRLSIDSNRVYVLCLLALFMLSKFSRRGSGTIVYKQSLIFCYKVPTTYYIS